MATFIMIPNATLAINWDASDGGTPVYTHIDNDNGDTEYLSSNTQNERIIVDLEAPSVAEGDMDFDETVTVTIKASARKLLSGNSFMILRQGGTAADSSTISNGTDNITVPGAGSYATYSGTGETTSDGSNDWVYGDLAGLNIRVDKFRNDRFGAMRVSYLYVEVDYTEAAVASADNATFFGANF